MATHSSILTWGIPWTEEPGRQVQYKELLTIVRLLGFTFHFDALEKEMATRCSVLA